MGLFHPKPLTRALRNNTAGVTSKDRTVVGSRPDGSSPSSGGESSGGGVPVGTIVMFSGAFAEIPSNWKLCDGTGGTPDLRDRFVLGTGVEADIGTTGGTVSHKHTPGTLELVETTVVLDAHTKETDTAVAGAGTRLTGPDSHTVTPHTHTFDPDPAKLTGVNQDTAGETDAAHVLPPFYTLAFIRRMS